MFAVQHIPCNKEESHPAGDIEGWLADFKMLQHPLPAQRKEYYDQGCHQRCFDSGADFRALVLRGCDCQKNGGGADRVYDEEIDDKGGQEIFDYGTCLACG